MKYRLGDQPEAGRLLLGGLQPVGQFGGLGARIGGAALARIRSGGASALSAGTSGGGAEPAQPGYTPGGSLPPRVAIP